MDRETLRYVIFIVVPVCLALMARGMVWSFDRSAAKDRAEKKTASHSSATKHLPNVSVSTSSDSDVVT